MSAVDTPNVTAHERLDRIEAIMANCEELLERISERLDKAGKEGDK